MTRLQHLFVFAALLAAAGCAAIPKGSEPALSGPASPQSSEGGHPMAQVVLMAGTNYAMSPQAEAQPMDMGTNMNMNMDMPGHGTRPMKMPAHGGQEAAPSASPTPQERHEGGALKP